MSSSSLIGRKLGKYLIVEMVGKGGMATVYKGLQAEVDRFVAIKVLPPHPGQDSSFVERFRQEARTIARLQHPHIVPLYDYGSDDDVMYLITPFIDGGSLNERIRRSPMPPSEAEQLIAQIAEALDYAHRQGVVHRDIKPDNILIDREGHALLSDFGIAKMIENTTPGITGTGGLIGTPAYMSPEQAQGLPVDGRSDIYSLGIVVFEMLTGRQPYRDETAMQVVMKHINAAPPSLQEAAENASQEMDDVLRKALAKNPDDRFETTADFVAAFRAAAQGHEPLKTVALSPEQAAAVFASKSTPSPKPTAAMAGAGDSNPSLGATATPSQTIVVKQGGLNNPFVLLGGFAIIAILIVAVMLILTRPQAITAPLPTDAATNIAQEVTHLPPTARATAAPSSGNAFFSSTNAPGDSLNLRIDNLPAHSSSQRLAVWLANSANGATTSLGTLSRDPLGSALLTYTDSNGAFLPGMFNVILITLEDSVGDLPAGEIIYAGHVPTQVNAALEALLINTAIPASDDKPAYEGSLLSGVIAEAQIAQNHAGLAAGSTSAGSMHTHNEHTINILNGTDVDYNNNGSGDNPGRGYGLAFFLDRINAALNDAIIAPEADSLLQGQIELIRVCINNATQWRDQVIELETRFVNAETLDGLQSDLAHSTDLSNFIVEGNDLNANGVIEPFEGECGLQQIAEYGIAVGNMALRDDAITLPELVVADMSESEAAATSAPAPTYDPNSEN